MKYYIEKTLNTDFESAVSRATESLKNEGFGVISEINIHEKLREKLNIDYPKYRILGACNPSLAYEALKKENKIGTMLPCNVIVREISENETEIAAVDPIASMQAVENQELGGVAMDVQSRLKKVIDSL
jgi:uncharacterized protein (DUF302 family)